jgi:hypothetical protein
MLPKILPSNVRDLMSPLGTSDLKEVGHADDLDLEVTVRDSKVNESITAEDVDVDAAHAEALRQHLLTNPKLYENRQDVIEMREFLKLHATPQPRVGKEYVYASVQATPLANFVHVAYFNNEHPLVSLKDRAYFEIDKNIRRFPVFGSLAGDALSEIYFFNSEKEFQDFNTLLSLKYSDYKITYKVLDQQAVREGAKAPDTKEITMKRNNPAPMAEEYTGRETKDGVWRVFQNGRAVAVAGPFKSREEAHAWIKKQKPAVREGGPFSYGAKKPKKGSVADLAAKKRREQEKKQKPVEPRDQMVGTAGVVKDEVQEASSTAAASMHAATRKRDPQKEDPKHNIRVGDSVTTKDGKSGKVVFVDGEEVHVKGTNSYYPDRITHHKGSELKKGVAEGAALKLHTIELTESQIPSYAKKYFECHNIERPHNKFTDNVRRLGSKKLNESAESQEIAPFVRMINSVDTVKTINVGDHFSVLAFEIVFAWKEINASGFTSPKEVVDIKMHSDGSINYIEFADGDRYPRLTPATYRGKPIIQTAYFSRPSAAESALTTLALTVPDGWELNTADVEQGVREGGPFSYGANPPRQGSVADLAAKKRREQERNQRPVESLDQMVGTARVIKSDEYRVEIEDGQAHLVDGEGTVRVSMPVGTWRRIAGRRGRADEYRVEVEDGQVHLLDGEGTTRVSMPTSVWVGLKEGLFDDPSPEARRSLLQDRIESLLNLIDAYSETDGANSQRVQQLRHEIESLQQRLVSEGYHDLAEEKQKGLDGRACWKGYKRMGTKKKGGRTVDNCVPVEETATVQEQAMDHDMLDVEDTPVAQAIARRIMMRYSHLLDQHGAQAVRDVINDIASLAGPVDEIGSSDVGVWVRRVVAALAEQQPKVAEGLGKRIRRAAAGWGAFDRDTPAELVKRNRSYDTDTLQTLAGRDGEKPQRHSPRDLQRRIIDRELRRRKKENLDEHKGTQMNKITKQISEYKTLAGWQAAARKSGAELVNEGTRAVRAGILVGLWDGAGGQLLEGPEDRLAAARDKAAKKGLIKDREEEKSATRKIAGSAYGGSKAKAEPEQDDDDAETTATSAAEPAKKRGRPAGSGKKAAPAAAAPKKRGRPAGSGKKAAPAPAKRGRPRKIAEGRVKDQLMMDAESMNREEFAKKYGNDNVSFWDDIRADINSVMIDGRAVDLKSIELDGVDTRDYPDFADAYFSAASFVDGTPLSDEDLDKLQDEYGYLVNELAHESLYEGEGAKNPYAIGMAAAKKSAGYGREPAHDLPKAVIRQAHDIGKKIAREKVTESAVISPDDGATAAPTKDPKTGKYPTVTSGPNRGREWSDKAPGPTNPKFKGPDAKPTVLEKSHDAISEIRQLAGLANAHNSGADMMKPYTVKEAKPDYLDLDQDGNKEEPMKKAAADAKEDEKKQVKEDINLNITANGEEDVCNMIRKLAGIPAVMVSTSEPTMDTGSSLAQAMQGIAEEYDNSPDETVYDVSTQLNMGGDLNRSKTQHANMPKAGDNPLATQPTMESLLKKYQDMLEDSNETPK